MKKLQRGFAKNIIFYVHMPLLKQALQLIKVCIRLPKGCQVRKEEVQVDRVVKVLWVCTDY